MKNNQMPEGTYPLVGDFALKIDNIKNSLLKFYSSKGFELVIPSIINSVHSNSSLKFNDNISGEQLEIIDDITPQISVIDKGCSTIKKYCYAHTIVKSNPDDFYSSRLPLQVGVEIYGDDTINADFMVIDSMLKSLEILDIGDVSLVIGDIAIFNIIIDSLGLNHYYKDIKDIFSKKSVPDLNLFIHENNLDDKLLQYLQCSDERLAQIFNIKKLTSEIHKIAKLKLKLSKYNIIYDFADTKTYNYHDGIIFSVYSCRYPKSIARGGRFTNADQRSATGFSFDLKFLLQHYNDK